MDPKMPKLPAYVFRRQNGSYRYKRNVPKKLRHLIGKDTLYRQLGESYSEAMNALPKVLLRNVITFFGFKFHSPACDQNFAWPKSLHVHQVC